MSFFSMIKNADDSFTHSPENERIPDNWYKRAVGDEYSHSIPQYRHRSRCSQVPQVPSTVGGNTGTPNSFVGIEPEDITGGIFNAASLTQGNNLAYFAMQFAT